MAPSQLAKLLGVTRQRLSNWERGEHDPPGEIIRSVSKYLGRSPRWFYGEAESNDAITRTNVYYNSGSNVDSDLDPDASRLAILASDPRTVAATGVVIEDSSRPWSAKGAQVVQMSIYAFLTTGLQPVKFSDPQPSLSLPSGTVLCFTRDDYPHPDVYLLVQSRADSDKFSIRYIDAAGNPQELITECQTDAPLRLSEWRVVGYAHAMIQGKRVVLLSDGIGPRRR